MSPTLDAAGAARRLRTLDSPAARTLAVVFVLLATFAIEQMVATRFGDGGVHAFLATRTGGAGLAVQLLSPLLHSSGAHLVGNLLVLVPLCLLFARHTSVVEFAAGLYGFGLIANQVVPLAVELSGTAVPLAVGASGVTFALAAHEGLLRAWWLAAGRRRDAEHGLLAALALAFAGERAAVLLSGPPAAGVSELAHVGGFAVGAVVAVLAVLGELRGDRRGHQ